MALERDLLKSLGLEVDGKVTEIGWQVLSMLLDHVNPYPNLTPGIRPSPFDIFEKIMSKVVPTAVELLLIRNGEIFLTWREDRFFGRGWHTPGSYISSGETLAQTAQRVTDKEGLGSIRITSARIIDVIPHPKSPRFHDVSALTVVEFEGNPRTTEMGRWFREEPAEMLDIHRSFWPAIEKLLRE